jgi:hypothetical protein
MKIKMYHKGGYFSLWHNDKKNRPACLPSKLLPAINNLHQQQHPQQQNSQLSISD